MTPHLARFASPDHAPGGSQPPRAALVACPDARPPAYEAVAGLALAGRLDGFVTGFYDRGSWPWPPRLRRLLGRRRHPGIPAPRVHSRIVFDLALAVERRLPAGHDNLRHRLARWRTEHFDRAVARVLSRGRPSAALLFSDVGSEHAGPLCRDLGIPTILSMVHGDVREEAALLELELQRSPDVFHLYLGDTPLDRRELDWLHSRRLLDLQWADLILVPSQHIASELARHGTPADRIRVVPYAADVHRFQPLPKPPRPGLCTFLFTGGIAQRKGIKYLLQAWHRIRRPGWRLQLLGASPRDLSPLSPWLDGVEFLGRVPHAEVPSHMASADVFVFPSLFEGSAVVTYEALACGLPSIVTPSAGSVVRDGIEGLLVPPADVETLAEAMQCLGADEELRREMSHSARKRAEQFTWARYHASLLEALDHLVPGHPQPVREAVA